MSTDLALGALAFAGPVLVVVLAIRMGKARRSRWLGKSGILPCQQERPEAIRHPVSTDTQRLTE